MKFHVTPDHISDGEPHSCSLCPVALAIDEALPGRCVDVRGNCVLIKGVRYLFTSDVVRWISNFDAWATGRASDRPLPFTFDLQIE